VKRCWEIVGDNLSASGWSWGCVSTVDREGRTIFVTDAHRGDGQRFVLHADEKLTAFLELEFMCRGQERAGDRHKPTEQLATVSLGKVRRGLS
jgi:hypothetical protein